MFVERIKWLLSNDRTQLFPILDHWNFRKTKLKCESLTPENTIDVIHGSDTATSIAKLAAINANNRMLAYIDLLSNFQLVKLSAT